MPTHVALIGKAGVVEQVWQNTRAASLDASRYPGKLVETEGDIAPGMRLVGGVFLASPPLVTRKAMAAEIKRRSDDLFPAGVREMLARMGGEAAIAVQAYVQEVARVGQDMLTADEIPQDYRDDKHWPKVPRVSMPVPVASTGLAHSVTVAPVINVTPGSVDVTREVSQVIDSPRADVARRDAEHDAASSGRKVVGNSQPFSDQMPVATVSAPVSPQIQQLVPVDEYQGHGSLDGLKVALVTAANAVSVKHEPGMWGGARKRFREGLAERAALVLAAQSVEGVKAAHGRLLAFIEGKQ